LEHLRTQAKCLRRDLRAGKTDAAQRVREFHPKFYEATDQEILEAPFLLADAQLAIAREYGFQSWRRLLAHIGKGEDIELPHHERILDQDFRRAVGFLDAGDTEGLKALLKSHPRLAHERVLFEGGNYFQNPGLLEFVAENPIRHGKLPPNIVDVARVILDAMGSGKRPSVDETLGLVCSGRVPRECGVQGALIDLLVERGADPNSALLPALGHGEFAAVLRLLDRGARLDLPTAAALGRTPDVTRLLPDATPSDRHMALALAAQHGRAEALRLLLEAGEDPSRYNPVGAHAHSTPLHQAALTGNLEVVKVLVEAGARLDIEDILFHGTPLGWAEYSGNSDVAGYLRSQPAGISARNG
jgi:hypothetical protein